AATGGTAAADLRRRGRASTAPSREGGAPGIRRAPAEPNAPSCAPSDRRLRPKDSQSRVSWVTASVDAMPSSD
ncbi:hypothetical protein L1885_28050, partial [Streptomyces fuscigenes]